MNTFQTQREKSQTSIWGLGRLLTATVFLAMSVAVPNTAKALAITGPAGQIFATGGDVVVDVLPSSSGFTNDINLYFAFPDLTLSTFIGIDNNVATVNLGPFSMGTELVFGILTDQNNIFVMGDASRNLDNFIHANVSATITQAGFLESWLVGFEDLFNGGDKDFNDAIIRVNLAAAPVPEPSIIALFAAGLIGIGIAGRRRKRS